MHNEQLHTGANEAIDLLRQLIAIPSMSREEDKAADRIVDFFNRKNIPVHRSGHNVWSTNKYFDASRPSILLNSHLDTVPPNAAYTKDPYAPEMKDGKLYGLGTTDAGASLVSLAAAFLHFYERENIRYNILFAATAEEEISGACGIESLFRVEAFKDCFVNPRSFAIVGEPTELDLAVAEKGLLVVDCSVKGVPGHAAREEGTNAIYKAMEAINWFKTFRFEKTSPMLGEVKMTVTSVHTANKKHNIVPAECNFTVDIRLTERYTPDEILETINNNVDGNITARSTRLRPSSIDINHPVVQAGIKLGKKIFGSPTLSDQALIPLPSLKCGPGNSAQSHAADEYVLTADIHAAIDFYTRLLNEVTGPDQTFSTIHNIQT
jgi:acetylornithine deacetylase